MKFGVAYEKDTESHIRIIYWDWAAQNCQPRTVSQYGINSRAVIEGWLPQLGMWAINDWVEAHQPELQQAWEDSRMGRVPALIEPLE